jgi:hypothetical protein
MKFSDIKTEWFSEMLFYESTRNGIFCKINSNRLSLSDKYFFDYCIKLFNKLPKHIRNECKISKYVIECKKYLMNL